ncbi:MAG: hypothetical protein F6K35_27800, partial [Okeania sp. SIO2H7]|nr:hypothetical protein [Okeania sp. SIO2H7]
ITAEKKSEAIATTPTGGEGAIATAPTENEKIAATPTPTPESSPLTTKEKSQPTGGEGAIATTSIPASNSAPNNGVPTTTKDDEPDWIEIDYNHIANKEPDVEWFCYQESQYEQTGHGVYFRPAEGGGYSAIALIAEGESCLKTRRSWLYDTPQNPFTTTADAYLAAANFISRRINAELLIEDKLASANNESTPAANSANNSAVPAGDSGEKAIATTPSPGIDSTPAAGQYRITLTDRHVRAGEYRGIIVGDSGVEKRWSIVLDDACNAIVSMSGANDNINPEAFIQDKQLEEMREALAAWAKENLKPGMRFVDLTIHPLWECPQKFASATIKGLPVRHKETRRDKEKGVDIVFAEVGACRAYFYLPLPRNEKSYILGIAETCEANQKGWKQYKDSSKYNRKKYPPHLCEIRQAAIAWFREAAPRWKPEFEQVTPDKKAIKKS